MGNRLDKIFFSSYQRQSANKINWKRYALSLIFGAITTGLVMIGIFFSAVFDSVCSVLVLGALAVMSALEYKK